MSTIDLGINAEELQAQVVERASQFQTLQEAKRILEAHHGTNGSTAP